MSELEKLRLELLELKIESIIFSLDTYFDIKLYSEHGIWTKEKYKINERIHDLQEIINALGYFYDV